MKLLKHYQKLVDENKIHDDPRQRLVLNYFQSMMDHYAAKKLWFLHNKTTKGLYLYGDVGIGKTFLMDFFFNHLSTKRKARFHFHHFMQNIDQELRQLQGKSNPIKKIAKNLAKKIHFLCLDEFMVNDIAYAMILAELLGELWKNKLTIIFTSNIAPDELYKGGLQRNRFLPAIELIKNNCEILALDSFTDYRFEKGKLTQVYFYPDNQTNQRLISSLFQQFAPRPIETGSIIIQNREIEFLKKEKKAIWFSFDAICNIPRSQLDFLEIAQKFSVVCISTVPCFKSYQTAQVILFMHLVDVFYDQKIKLILLAEDSLEKLYIEGEKIKPFKRTISRLKEMQSIAYQERTDLEV